MFAYNLPWCDWLCLYLFNFAVFTVVEPPPAPTGLHILQHFGLNFNEEEKCFGEYQPQAPAAQWSITSLVTCVGIPARISCCI